jgi:hypothetical protein
MSMSSNVGINFSSTVLTTYSMQIDWHDAGGVMKSGDDRSGLSFTNIIISLSAS